MAIPTNRSLVERPAKDEWGVYDPQQAGLAALFARLDTKDAKPAPSLASSVRTAAAKPAVQTAEKPAPVATRPSLRDAK